MTREEAIKTLKGEAWICCQEKYLEARDMAFEILETEPCEDMISREAAIDAIKNYASMLWEKYHEPFPKSTVMEMIQALPPVTPAVKIGKWIQEGGKLPYCSECGAYSDDADRGIYFKDKGESVNEEARFCPNCGSYNGGENERNN